MPWVTEYTHKYGNDVMLSPTEDDADRLRATIVLENLNELKNLEDRKAILTALKEKRWSDAVSLYTKATEDRPYTESFSTCEMSPEPTPEADLVEAVEQFVIENSDCDAEDGDPAEDSDGVEAKFVVTVEFIGQTGVVVEGYRTEEEANLGRVQLVLDWIEEVIDPEKRRAILKLIIDEDFNSAVEMYCSAMNEVMSVHPVSPHPSVQNRTVNSLILDARKELDRCSSTTT